MNDSNKQQMDDFNKGFCIVALFFLFLGYLLGTTTRLGSENRYLKEQLTSQQSTQVQSNYDFKADYSLTSK